MSDLVFSASDALLASAKTIPPQFQQPLRPHITGGHAALFRYSVAAEKELISIGDYTAGSDVDHDWPELPTGAIVDQSYAQLYIDDALLRYFSDAIGSGDTIAPVVNYANRIRAAATRWKTTSYSARSASLLDRDVAVGDKVWVSNGTVSVWTTVRDFVAEVVAASVASTASADVANSSTQSASVSITQTAGTANDVTEAAAHTYFKGLVKGNISETYTITVTQAPTSAGDATTAKLSVTSASGLDDVAEVIPSPYGSVTPIGTQGARATFSHTSDDFVVGQVWTLTVQHAFTKPVATGAGTYTGTVDRTYAVTVSRGGIANATSPLAAPSVQATVNVTGGGTSGGSLGAGTYYLAYTFVSLEGETTIGSSTSASFTVLDNDDIPRATIPSLPTNCVGINVYLTNVGGTAPADLRLYRKLVTAVTVDLTDAVYGYKTYANSSAPPGTNTATVTTPQITAVSVTGDDASGPTVVPNSSTAVAVGSFGATISFDQTQLRKGDKYYVVCTAASAGSVQTLVLADDLPSTLTGASDLALKLHIVKPDFAVPQERTESAPDLNWDTSADAFTVKGTMTAFDSTWTSSGVQQALPIVGGAMYVHYRAWLQTYVETVAQITTIYDLAGMLGTNHPDNPLCYAVGKALGVANGYAIKFTAVSDPSDTAAWTIVPPILEGLDDCYALVPLSQDTTVLAAWKAHAEAQSSDENACWRVVWGSLAARTTVAIVDSTTTSDLQTAMGTLGDDPGTTGTQYTKLTCTTTNAKFVTKGVRAGDKLRYLYAVDGFGNTTYTTFTVASVLSEDALLLTSGNATAVAVAQKFEVWRNMTRTEVASDLVTRKTALGNSQRLRLVWPDIVEDGSTSVAGYFLAAAMAGLSGGVSPHQGLRHIRVDSFSGFSRSTSFFNNGQLNTLATAGFFVVGVDNDAVAYVRAAKTTDQTSVSTGEESAVRVLDTIRHMLHRRVRSFIGRTNVTQPMMQRIAAEIRAAISYGKSSTFIETLGSMLIDGDVGVVRRHSLLPNVIVAPVAVRHPFSTDAVTLTIAAATE